jgi:ATP-dependent Clp protease ATP-binding subunit ClpX
LLRQITPEDLMAFGMIPEIVGRLPVMVNVDPLDKAALVRILIEPRNALVKQFQRLLSLDDVELVLTDEALSTAADMALKRETGARGLRTIIENALLDVMYEVPSHREIKKVIVDREVIERTKRPQIVGENGQALGWTDDAPLDAAA